MRRSGAARAAGEGGAGRTPGMFRAVQAEEAFQAEEEALFIQGGRQERDQVRAWRMVLVVGTLVQGSTTSVGYCAAGALGVAWLSSSLKLTIRRHQHTPYFVRRNSLPPRTKSILLTVRSLLFCLR